MRVLNESMLNVISAVQAKKALALAEIPLGLEGSWLTSSEAYYNALPDFVMKEAGLRKNRYDFETVLAFPVTEEIRNTVYEELGKFPFTR